MIYLEGKVLEKEGFVHGYVKLENENIEVGKGKAPRKVLARGYILPYLINSHVHTGDTFIRKKIRNLPRDIEKLVAPPHGIKHRLLSRASRKEIVEGMKESLKMMKNRGVFAFCDFREGGVEGVYLLKDALRDVHLNAIILSRPSCISYDREEIKKLLDVSNGIGISSISDWDIDILKKISADTKRRGKLFSLHASERIREDIDLILDLKPDFLVHMVKAEKGDLEMVRDEDIPVVLCPRSNAFFELKANYDLMKKVGVKVLLGTDNCMIAEPDVLAEVRWILKNCKAYSIEELLKAVSYDAAEFFGIKDYGFEKGVVVVDTKSLKPIFVSIGKDHESKGSDV